MNRFEELRERVLKKIAEKKAMERKMQMEMEMALKRHEAIAEMKLHANEVLEEPNK